MLSLLKRDSSSLPNFVKDIQFPPGRSIALFDADGTLYTGDASDEFTKYALQQGLITCQELWPRYLEIFARDQVEGSGFALQLFSGLSSRQLEEAAGHWWQSEANLFWNQEVVESFFYLAEHGVEPWIVSGTASLVLNPLKSCLPIKGLLATECQVDPDQILTGKVEGDVCVGEGKVKKVGELANQAEVVFACGNSLVDLPMIELSTQVCWAFHPEKKLEEESTIRNWHITRN